MKMDRSKRQKYLDKNTLPSVDHFHLRIWGIECPMLATIHLFKPHPSMAKPLRSDEERDPMSGITNAASNKA